MSFKKLVFSGGGVKGIAFIGALKYLEEKNIVKNVHTIVGTSVGALFGLLVTLGYKSEQIFKIIIKIDLKKLQNINTDSVLNFFDVYGIDDFDNILNLLNILIDNKMGNKNITFEELYLKTKIKLIIPVTCLNYKKLIYFDYINYPNVQINLVIKMAMCIPILFTPVLYENLYYIDAGIINNFSIDLFDINDKEVIGFVFKNNDFIEIKSFQEYIKTLIFTSINEKEVDIIKKYKKNSVIIDCGNYSLVDFDITDDDKKKLYQIGYDNIKDFLNKKNNKKWNNLKNKLFFLIKL